MTAQENYALCCTFVFVFYMKVFQAILSSSSGGGLSLSAHNFASESDEFTTWS